MHVFPLSFAEFMQVYSGNAYDGCTYGGLPMTLAMQTDEQKAAYLKLLFDETYLKDIVERNSVGKPQALKELIDCRHVQASFEFGHYRQYGQNLHWQSARSVFIDGCASF